ncbi:unnamed protein product [Ectocarpus sp. CCAP 1310/34]|nr:unnamed protein product [Ectocarpus sp. CCAP 1310/34]
MQAAQEKVESAMANASDATSMVLGVQAAVSEEDLVPLVKAAEFVRVAGGWSRMVQKLLAAVDEDQIGTHAVGAKDRVVAAVETTLADINDSATKASVLEAYIKNAKGGDEAAALRRLEDNLNSLKADFDEVKELAPGAQKAADLCQVEKTQMMTAAATVKVIVFEGEARPVVNGAESAAQAFRHQNNAFEKAKASAGGVMAAGEKAAISLRVPVLVAEASREEVREAEKAHAEKEKQAKQKATAQAEAVVAAKAKAAATATVAEKDKEKDKEVAAVVATAASAATKRVAAVHTDRLG